jgi:hypothetical protein
MIFIGHNRANEYEIRRNSIVALDNKMATTRRNTSARRKRPANRPAAAPAGSDREQNRHESASGAGVGESRDSALPEKYRALTAMSATIPIASGPRWLSAWRGKPSPDLGVIP